MQLAWIIIYSLPGCRKLDHKQRRQDLSQALRDRLHMFQTVMTWLMYYIPTLAKSL